MSIFFQNIISNYVLVILYNTLEKKSTHFVKFIVIF